MVENQAGVTALITAYARAYHAAHDTPKIFDDFLADALFSAEERAQFDHNLTQLLPLIDPTLAATQPGSAAALARVMQVYNGPITLSRSRYTEDCLEAAAAAEAAAAEAAAASEAETAVGVRQVVILGAGMDTFAFRRPDLLERLDVFEVDHPATQAIKRQRVAAAGWAMPGRLHFVPVDFAKDDLAGRLIESGFDSAKVSFFSWLGVTFYLPHAVALETLRSLAGLCAAGSSIVFDFIDAEGFDPQRASKRMQFMQWLVRQAGEPMKTFFDPHTLAGELRPLGLEVAETLSPAEIEARYFQGRSDGYHAFEHVHFARVVKVE